MHTFLVKDRRLEWWIALYTFFYGAWICQPVESMNSPAYSVLLFWAPEQVWGLMATGIGSFHCTALYINGRAKWTPFVRLIATACNAIIFGVIATGFGLVDPDTTAVVTYVAIMFAAVVAFMGAVRDATRVVSSCRKGLKGGRNVLDA